MREVGDPLADDVVTQLFESGGIYSVIDLMKTLIVNDHPAPAQFPPALKNYLEATAHIPAVDQAMVEGGQRMFQKCGPEILVVLACYSLPASYAARKGVQVLYRTGYLNNRANHRLFETTQMVMDVLVPGGLDANGRGVRTAQKVRLMHAAVRRLIQTDPENPWDAEFGVPINQEDLAGTFMVFTYLIVDGLNRLGIATTAKEQQGYLETWKIIGRIMGIQEAMIPETMAEAKVLCERIQARQVQPCREGKLMNDALLHMMQHNVPPGPWKHWPAGLMRHFLPPEIADGFEIPKGEFNERILMWVVRKFALSFIQGMITVELGGKRTAFVLPTNLHHEWARSHRPSVWQQLRR
jgi:hypothetical protein